MSRVVLTIAILALCAGTAKGQSDSVLTHALSDSTSVLVDRLSEAAAMRDERLPIGSIRLASSSGGFVFGLLLGGYSGYELVSETCKNCRESQGDALVMGAAIGGALGAALGAAFLDLRSVCAFDKRLVRSFTGSVLGASALFFATSGMDRGRSIYLIPIGAIGGSLSMLGRCWKSRY